MDIFDVIEEEFDEFFDSVERPRRVKMIRNRANFMEELDDVDFRALTNLTSKSVSSRVKFVLRSLLVDILCYFLIILK